MNVIINKKILEQIVDEIVNEERSFHSKNVNELEKAEPPIFPQSQMPQQLSTSEVPVDDAAFVPATNETLGKAAMQLAKKVKSSDIALFYKNLKRLVAKNSDEQINEAKLKQFIDDPEPEPATTGRKRRERDLGVLPSTPDEDQSDMAAELPNRPSRAPGADQAPRKRAERAPRAASRDLDMDQGQDIVAKFLNSLRGNIESAEWMKNVSIPLSSLVVGDANKLLAAIVKKMGEENVTEGALESAFRAAIDSSTYEIKDGSIVISVPDYGIQFKYNLRGDKRNLFSHDQYKELLLALGSSESAGTQYEESWGPKYANAIRQLSYARGDKELRDALVSSIAKIQNDITNAILSTYPKDQDLISATDLADKLYVANDAVIDAITQAGLRTGINQYTVDVSGSPIQVTLEIPETPTAIQAIEDSRFAGVLEDLLSITPDRLENYVAKKARAKRSAVQMSRGQENYFYDLGSKIGGKNFKMSAAEFQSKLAAAQEVIDEAGIEMTDAELVSLILLSGDVIDKNQFALLEKIKDYLYGLFEQYLHMDASLIKKFGIDQLLEIIPEDVAVTSLPIAEAFDDFCENAIKAFTDKSVKNKLFDIYDSVVDKPSTKKYFKDNAGTKHSQIYDQPPSATRRAKDVSNLIGNLRHISEYMMKNAKDMRQAGQSILGSKMEKAAKELVDPDTVVSTMELFFAPARGPGNKKIIPQVLVKPIGKAAKEILKHDVDILTQPQPKIDLGREEVAPAAPASPPTPAPAAISYTPDDINAAYDEIIAKFITLTDAQKESMLQDLESAADPGETVVKQMFSRKYPALTNPEDYSNLVDKLMSLNEINSRSLLLRLIHGYNR